MKLPYPQEFEFGSLLWKELLAKGSEWTTKEQIYNYLKKLDSEGRFNWCEGIKCRETEGKAKKLLLGFTLLDILDWSRAILLDFKMWQLFEDLVAELFRCALQNRPECAVVRVDRYSGFMGLESKSFE